MIDPFDILRVEEDGSVLWLETAPSLEKAKSRVEELASSSPFEYMIFSHQTQAQIVIRLDSGERERPACRPAAEGGGGLKNEELQYSTWQEPLQELILESDRERLAEKLPRVEALISERIELLNQGSNSRGEGMALRDALTILRVLKREKLDTNGNA